MFIFQVSVYQWTYGFLQNKKYNGLMVPSQCAREDYVMDYNNLWLRSIVSAAKITADEKSNICAPCC